MRILLSILISGFLWASTTNAQFKNDNTVFRNVFLEDLCAEIQSHPNAFILDVRSKGEYFDTSSFVAMNMGRLKGAYNIPVQELKDRFPELPKDRKRPIYIYCSHSQRSRRASKMLADSGYSNVVNVNGAMSELNRIKDFTDPCLNALYETTLPYKLLSPKAVNDLLQSGKPVFVLDIREDSAFNGVSRNAQVNQMGKLKGANLIPFSILPQSLTRIPVGPPILLIDSYGEDSPKAAKVLLANGHTDVSLLMNGMDMWMGENQKELPNRDKIWTRPPGIDNIAPEEVTGLLNVENKLLVLDLRPAKEFSNGMTGNDTWKNKGHLKGAVNIPQAELNKRLPEIQRFKNQTVLVYAFGGGPEVFESAKLLAQAGFRKVLVLSGGLWDMRWKAANIKGLSHLNQIVVDVPPDNF